MTGLNNASGICEADIAAALAPWSARLQPDGGDVAVRLFRDRSGVADSTALYWVGQGFLMHLSSETFPDVAAEEVAAMETARERLGAAGGAILDVPASGRIGARSFMLLPRCVPVAPGRVGGWLPRRRLRPKVLHWLRDLAALSEPANPAAAQKFTANLTALAELEQLSPDVRAAAEAAVAEIAAGRMRPRFTPMHGDLWRGNILTAPGRPFVVIDWRGSAMQGYGIFDLIRFGSSYGVGPAGLRSELLAHAAVLGIEPAQTRSVLLAALGHIALHLGEFPLERFVEMAESCHHVWARSQKG